MSIDVEVKDVKHLNRIIADLRGKPTVSGVTRVSG
jgi:(p)ppGpp synthase/HD superfamily hydrolase